MDKVTFIQDFSKDLVAAGVPRSDWERTLNEIGRYEVSQALSDVGDQRSPVTGRQFKKLTAEYAAEKAAESSSPVANLELKGELLDALTFRVLPGGRLEYGVWGSQAPKADGHNNHSGDSKIPRRPFIPDKRRGENFRPEIRDEIRSILLQNASGVRGPFKFNQV